MHLFYKKFVHIKMDNNNDLPYEVIEMAKLATDKLLPMKSKEQYCKEYDLFVLIVLVNILLCLIIGSLIGIFIFIFVN